MFDAVDTLDVLLPGVRRHGRDADASTPSGWPSRRRQGSRWPPTSPSGWSARACRSARRTRSPGRASRCARSGGSSSWDLTDADLAAISAHLTPEVREVLTVEGSLASRCGVGGTAPVRVAEQLAAARVRAGELRVGAARESRLPPAADGRGGLAL